ncbi:MAG: hypothetical protein A2Y62_08010 [Candidatus Fischerbacteria bacterium RBG_13_37_8]|uniref:Uncharacterized protein n=1 Tax=Candidatus Fischerbacteria bacterium RBG_13_37_8 TaxID=1817863 RepID=A0A1F5V5B2_9BACT|nr:MAG: hypothetical protein A2Y62_08010 [Candidatus Fischerbacteria bacterium RBG_13_37_8]
MIECYRYISQQVEKDQIINERKIQSINAATNYATWYTITRYDDENTAQQELALPLIPSFRIGPIRLDEMPNLSILFRSVAPAFGQPGGGIEVMTELPIWLFGLWDFGSNIWIL